MKHLGRIFYAVHCQILCEGLYVYCLMYVIWQPEGSMTITPFYRGENYGLERLSCGQAVQLGMAASGLEPRESCLRLAYMFTLCTELSPTLPRHRHWSSIQSCTTPVLCFFLSHRLQALGG